MHLEWIAAVSDEPARAQWRGQPHYAKPARRPHGEVKVARAFLVELVECGAREGVPTPRRTRPGPLGCSKNLHDERRCPAAIETERGRAELHLHQIAMAPVSRRRAAPPEQLPLCARWLILHARATSKCQVGGATSGTTHHPTKTACRRTGHAEASTSREACVANVGACSSSLANTHVVGGRHDGEERFCSVGGHTASWASAARVPELGWCCRPQRCW